VQYKPDRQNDFYLFNNLLLIFIALNTYYLRIENAEGYVLIAIYLFIYLYACYSQNSKSIEPNRMKFGGLIGYYPGTI